MSWRVGFRIGAACLFVILFGAVRVLAANVPPQFDARTMIPVREVKTGMRGTAKSVFKGVEISEFGVEVIGILPKMDLGGDLVLIRVLDGPVVERGCGIVGGMSGSPVSIDGRLLGAIAYTWPFEKEPIGGVTPMESMLNSHVEKGAEKTASSGLSPVSLHGRRLTRARVVAPDETRRFTDTHTINMAPVGLMTCAGCTRRTLEDFAEFLEPYGIEPVTGPGSMDEVVDADLVPGAAVSIDLMRGDFDSSMIGTVTYRAGDSILAFGHPMMQLGAIDMPLATAFIHGFIPSYNRSDKMGSSMKPLGAARMDGTWSVGGLVGPQAEMVPVDISVTDETTGRTRTYGVEVAKEKALTQQLVSMSIANAVEAAFRGSGEGTARVKYEVEGERGAKVQRQNVYWDRSSIAAACTREIGTTIYVLRRNPFDPQEPARVKMDVSLSDENTGAAIEEVYTDQTVAKAGEKLTVHVVLRPWDGEPFEQVVELDLPEDLQRGTMRIGVCGGEYAYTMRTRLGLLQPDFQDLPSIIEDIEKTEFNNQLFVAAALPNKGIGVAEYLLHRLPSSIAGIMSSSRTTDIRGGKEEVSRLIDREHVILGLQYLTLGTEDKSGARAATPPPTSQQGGPTPPGPPGRTRAGGSPEPAARINPLTAPPLDWAATRIAQDWPSRARGTRGPLPVGEGEDPTKAPSPSPPKPSKKVEGAKNGEEEPPSPEEDDEDEGVISRQLSEWRQSTESDFKEGEAEGAAIRSDGALYVADKVAAAWQTEKHRGVWSVAGGEEGPVYFGTGKDGRIYKADIGSGPESLHETGELAVHALTFSGEKLYAGTIPNGKLFRLDPSDAGSGEVVAELPDHYIWALVPDDSGGVYAGTGSQGRVYHVSADGKAEMLADLPAQHVLCLARLGDDLLAGTAENGVVYRVRPDGTFEAVYDDDDPAVTGIGVASDGEVYACTSTNGHVVRITPGKEPLVVLELEKKAATAMAVVGDTVYVGTADDGKILAVLGPDRHAVGGKTEASEVSCLAAAGKRLLVGSANPGRLEVVDTAAKASGTFESAVLDAKRTARWASMLWTGDVPDGSEVEVRARVGHTSDPDDGTWSSWSSAYVRGGVTKTSVSPSRYLQYQVSMTKADSSESPVFRSLLLKYLPANQKPTLELKEPKGGGAISGKYTLKWEGKDEDEDKLRYAVYVRPEGEEEWELLEDDIEDQEYEWDTEAEGVEEGVVTARVVVSDGLSNPGDGLQEEAVAFPVIVDNTAPRFRQEGDAAVGEDKTVVAGGSVWDEASAIVGIEYRVGDEGKWKTVAATDGLFDSRAERFELHTAALDPGEQVITVRVRDAAGNKTDTDIKVTIPGEKKEEPGDAKDAPEGEKPKTEDDSTDE